MALAVALPMATASVRSFFILASGLNGLPLTMPMEATSPRVSGIERVDRFVLDQLIQVLEEAEIVG